MIWSAKKIPPGDILTSMSDLFFSIALGGSAVQKTDTHLRLQEGNSGSFNWRMKFPIQLPLEADNEGKGYLRIQAWDLDLLYNDCLAETWFDLSHHLNQAYQNYRKVQRHQKKHAVLEVFSASCASVM